MILKKIELSNIYGHKAAALDLSGVGAAVLVGANGAGKSSLIDGALFALFGRGAVRGGSMANVVRVGEQVGGARVEFELSGVRYKVERTYSTRTKAGASTVALWREEGGEWIAASERGDVRGIDEQIERMIGADLAAFSAACVMRQGDAAAFSGLSPAEKLARLAALVGADAMNAASEAAAAQLREATRELAAAERAASGAESARARLAKAVEEEERASAQLREEEERAAAAAAGVEEIRARAARYVEEEREARAQYDQLRREASAARAAHVQNESEIEHVDRRLARARASLERREEAVAELRAALAAAPRKGEASAALEQLKAAIAAEHHATGLAFTASQFAKIDRDALARDQARLDAATVELGTIDAASGRAAQLREKIAQLAPTIAQIDAAHERHVNLARAQAEAIKLRPATCAMDHCGLIAPALLARDDLRRIEAQDPAAELREEVESLRTGLAGESQILSAWGTREEVEAASLALVEEIDALARRIEEASAQLREEEEASAAAAELATLPPAAELAARVATLTEDVERLGAAARDAEKASKSLKFTESLLLADRAEEEAAAAQLAALLLARESLPDSIAIELASSQAAALHGHKSRAAAETLRTLAAEEPGALAAAASASAARLDVARCGGLVEALREEVERTGAALAALQAARAAKIEIEAARDFLRAAPQMLVASSIPRVEAAANEILSEIAPGVRCRLERQRATKAGEMRNEIVILVERNGQARDLDTFSGGERFRVDIALRLALARVASSRSTAPALETLIVDEGWGALDAEGVAALKDCFARLRGRFGLILVVTHVQDVIDLFGTVIEVANGGEETTITIY